MTITETQAAHAVKYLVAAGALTAVADQHIVWADYLNADTGVPEMTDKDLLPAARHCLHKWAAEGRTWRVDLPRFAQSVKAIRNQRSAAYKAKHGDPYPAIDLPGADYVRWLQAARSAVAAGATDPAEVEAAAFAAIGRPVPAPEITERHDVPTTVGRRV